MFHVEHKMKDIKKCPVCGHTESRVAMVCLDHTVSKESFNISECTSCGFWYTNPIPDKSVIGEYYKAEAYVSHTSSKKGLINRIYHWVRKRAIANKFKLVKSLSSGKRLLDIGCGTGDFLAFSHNNGMEVTGLEPDPDARQIAAKKVEGHVLDLSELYNFKKDTFDVITMWHVLEHVYDLNEDIDQILDVLKDDGVLIVAVPNRSSHDAEKYKTHWAAYDVPRHLYHFREKDIINLFRNHKAKHVSTIPMKWDAFYVSMLSQKIMNKHFLPGVFRGWISNMKAKNNTYSSQIYVIRKNSGV